MVYPYYPTFNNYSAYQQPYQPQPQTGNSPQAKTQIVVRVPNYDAVKNFYVEPGNPVTFFDDNAPFCYVKSGGASPVDPPKIRVFELVERTGTETSKNSDLSEGIQGNIDISLYAKTAEIKPYFEQIEHITKEVEKLRGDVDAMKGDNHE